MSHLLNKTPTCDLKKMYVLLGGGDHTINLILSEAEAD